MVSQKKRKIFAVSVFIIGSSSFILKNTLFTKIKPYDDIAFCLYGFIMFYALVKFLGKSDENI